MTNKYEEYIEELESGKPSPEAVEAAMDSMAFVLGLHNTFKENGVDLGETPDCSSLENVIDSVYGELAAACLFLSEKSFAKVPDMLRAIGSFFDKIDKPFKDPTGNETVSVPVVIRKGFMRLASRVEATRVQQRQMLSVLKQNT